MDNIWPWWERNDQTTDETLLGSSKQAVMWSTGNKNIFHNRLRRSLNSEIWSKSRCCAKKDTPANILRSKKGCLRTVSISADNCTNISKAVELNEWTQALSGVSRWQRMMLRFFKLTKQSSQPHVGQLLNFEWTRDRRFVCVRVASGKQLFEASDVSNAEH